MGAFEIVVQHANHYILPVFVTMVMIIGTIIIIGGIRNIFFKTKSEGYSDICSGIIFFDAALILLLFLKLNYDIQVFVPSDIYTNILGIFAVLLAALAAYFYHLYKKAKKEEMRGTL